MISQPIRPLIEVLAESEDVHHARGPRHPLVAILALVCVATLCGYRSYSAMAEWGRHYGRDLVVALGFTRPTSPCAATLYRVLRQLDRAAFDLAIGVWAEGVLAVLPTAEDMALALDGKTLRGSRKEGWGGSHLLAAVSQRLGLPLAQTVVDDKTNEIGAVQAELRGVVLEGRVLTMDALLTQQTVAQAIIDGGGDYVMVAKDNQLSLVQNSAGLLATPAHVPGATPLRQVTTVERGHGRREHRTVTVRGLLPGDCDWPGAQQVFRIDRRRVRVRTGVLSTEVTYGVTSLPQRRPRRRVCYVCCAVTGTSRTGSIGCALSPSTRTAPKCIRAPSPRLGHSAHHGHQPAPLCRRGQHRRGLPPLCRPTLARPCPDRPTPDYEMTLAQTEFTCWIVS